MVNITGIVVLFIEVIFCLAWGMGRENGCYSMETVIKEIIWMIKKNGKGVYIWKSGDRYQG